MSALPTRSPFHSINQEEIASSRTGLETSSVTAMAETAEDGGLTTRTMPKKNSMEGIELVEDEMKLDTEWNDMLSLPDSQERKEFEAEFVLLLTSLLSRIAGFVAVLVTDVHPGSIIVSYTVKVSSGSSLQYKSAMQGVYTSGSLGKYSVSKTKNSAFAKDDEEDEDGPPKFVILVIVAALLLVVIGVGLFLLHKRRQRTVRAKSFDKRTRKRVMTNLKSVGHGQK